MVATLLNLPQAATRTMPEATAPDRKAGYADNKCKSKASHKKADSVAQQGGPNARDACLPGRNGKHALRTILAGAR